MIDWIIGLMVAKWWADKEEAKKVMNNPPQDVPNLYEYGWGYTKDGETIRDLA